MVFFWKAGVVFQQLSNRWPEHNNHSILFLIFFLNDAKSTSHPPVGCFVSDVEEGCSPCYCTTRAIFLQPMLLGSAKDLSLNFVDAISVTFVLFLLSFRSSFVLAVKHFIHVVIDWRILMLELSLYSSLFMVKGKCIPRLKKGEDRREAGPVRSWGNRKYKDLVTLQPFLLPNGNPFPNAISIVVSRFGCAPVLAVRLDPALVQDAMAGRRRGRLCHVGPRWGGRGQPRSPPLPRSLPRRLAFPLVFWLKCAQPGNKTGMVSGVFVVDTECMKCFLVGWEPVCLQEQRFEEAKKTHTDISLLIY